MAINHGGNLRWVDVPVTETMYGTEWQLRDLTGDGRLEFVFYEQIGGSGGIVDLNIYQLEANQLKPVFLARDHYQIEGIYNQYLGNNRVRIAIPPRQLVWEYELAVSNYDVNDRKADQEIKNAFNRDWVDPFSGYDLEDLDGDGNVEVIGHQRVCGVAHVEAIGNLRQVFSWDGAQFSLQDTWLYQYREGGTVSKVTPAQSRPASSPGNSDQQYRGAWVPQGAHLFGFMWKRENKPPQPLIRFMEITREQIC